MKNDEKMCPLTKMTCYAGECAWWYFGDCAMIDLVNRCQNASDELYHIRREMEDR